MSEHQAMPPRGWYPDPESAPRERWWTGTEWSTYSHRPIRRTFYSAAYVHSFWAGPNRQALVGRIFGQISCGSMLALIVFAFISFATVVGTYPSGPAGSPVLVLVILAAVVQTVCALMAFILGLVALRRAKVNGALGLATWCIAVGASSCLVGAGIILSVALTMASGLAA